MIYLRFAIADSPSNHQAGVAEFMFQSEDARECTRQAVLLLREHGCRPLGIDHAWEGFDAGDFPVEPGLLRLFDEASSAGVAMNVRRGVVPERKENRLAVLALSYAAGR